MATIPTNTLTTGSATTISNVELTGTDDLAAKSGTLFIDNQSASPVTINIDGDEAPTSFVCRGAGTIDLSNGYDIEVAAGEQEAIKLGDIAEVLRGTVAVTGGTADVFAFILQ